MKKKKRSSDEDDDGRVIANMDVEGMPWNSQGMSWRFGLNGFIKKQKNKKSDSADLKDNYGAEIDKNISAPPPLSKRETLFIIFHSVLSGLTVAAIFGTAGFLFILFCVKVWFV